MSQLCNKTTSSHSLTKQATHPETKLLQTTGKRAIANDRKCKSSHIHVLQVCDDEFCFVESNQSDNQVKDLKTSNRTKEAKKESKNNLASFLCPVDTKTRPKALNKLRGVANLQYSQKYRFLAPAKEIRMRALVPRERHNRQSVFQPLNVLADSLRSLMVIQPFKIF